MDTAFVSDPDADERIKEAIAKFAEGESTKLEQQLFKRKKRLADAERALLSKSTKGALESQRVAGSKIEWALGKLSDLGRASGDVSWDARASRPMRSRRPCTRQPCARRLSWTGFSATSQIRLFELAAPPTQTSTR
jgi:hypothetical protein